MYVRAVPLPYLNKNIEWFTYPGVWTCYILILFFYWLVVLSVFVYSRGMAWTVITFLTAQAAIEIVRLTGNSNSFKEVTLSAIIVIQTAFRGFQRESPTSIEGTGEAACTRKQTKLTLQYIQALVRVQDQMRDHRARLSHEGGRRSSALAAFNTSRDSRLHQNTYERRHLQM